jgi:hypothetical protein
LVRQRHREPNSDSDDDQIGWQGSPIVHHHRVLPDHSESVLEVEHDTVLVQRPDEVPQFRAHDALERTGLRRHDANLKPSRAQRRSDLLGGP